jgi:hypothetical protein
MGGPTGVSRFSATTTAIGTTVKPPQSFSLK